MWELVNRISWEQALRACVHRPIEEPKKCMDVAQIASKSSMFLHVPTTPQSPLIEGCVFFATVRPW